MKGARTNRTAVRARYAWDEEGPLGVDPAGAGAVTVPAGGLAVYTPLVEGPRCESARTAKAGEGGFTAYCCSRRGTDDAL